MEATKGVLPAIGLGSSRSTPAHQDCVFSIQRLQKVTLIGHEEGLLRLGEVRLRIEPVVEAAGYTTTQCQRRQSDEGE
jgi:hypothetical protein